MHKLILKAGRDKSLKRRHPWVFSGAVAKVQGSPGSGETIGVWSATGEFLAVAAYSPASQIVARAWDWKERAIDGAFFKERVARAIHQRSARSEQPCERRSNATRWNSSHNGERSCLRHDSAL